MTKHRSLALGAAVALGASTIFAAMPAFATEGGQPESQNPAVKELPVGVDAEALKAIDSANDFENKTGGEAVAVGTNAEGELVLLANKDDLNNPKVKAFAEVANNDSTPTTFAQVLFTEPAVAYGQNNVIGGAGYLYTEGAWAYFCSIGFSAWGPEGQPAALSAGHCTGDKTGQALALSKPSTDDAAGGTLVAMGAPLGQFGFYRFGGPGNTNGADEDPASTDISVIDVTGADLTMIPAVTSWATGSTDDLSAGIATPIRRVADPVSGSVSKSGRTTGLTSGSTIVTLENEDGELEPGEILDGWI